MLATRFSAHRWQGGPSVSRANAKISHWLIGSQTAEARRLMVWAAEKRKGKWKRNEGKRWSREKEAWERRQETNKIKKAPRRLTLFPMYTGWKNVWNESQQIAPCGLFNMFIIRARFWRESLLVGPPPDRSAALLLLPFLRVSLPFLPSFVHAQTFSNRFFATETKLFLSNLGQWHKICLCCTRNFLGFLPPLRDRVFARNVDGPSSSLRMGLSRGSLFQIDSKPFFSFFLFFFLF